MTNYWNIPGIPRKGWTSENVYDVRADGQSVEETDYEICMMCNNERIRYVHELSHPAVDEIFKVGCICAEKMTEDYINPQEREKEVRNKSIRRSTFLKKLWDKSQKGNYTLSYRGHRFTIFKDRLSTKYKCVIDEQFGDHKFDTIDQAKSAIFDGIEFYKRKGLWK